jgi:hypothetical protein
MDQQKIDYLRNYYDLGNYATDADIETMCADSIGSSMYDLKNALRDLWQSVEVAFPRLFSLLRGKT